MAKTIQVEIEDDEFERLKEFKERQGYTWEGVLKHGAITA